MRIRASPAIGQTGMATRGRRPGALPLREGRGAWVRLGDASPRRRHGNVGAAPLGADRRNHGPCPARGHCHKRHGALKDEDHLAPARGRRRGAVLAGRLPGFADRPADFAGPAGVEGLPCRGCEGLGPCVGGEHPRPCEDLGDVQHGAAGAEPGAEQGDRGNAAEHPRRNCDLWPAAQAFPLWTTAGQGCNVRSPRAIEDGPGPGMPHQPQRHRSQYHGGEIRHPA